MRGFQPRSAAGAQEQRFADGGFVQGIKRAFGMDEERNAQIAAYRARAAAEKAQAAQQQQAQQPQQPQQRAISDYSGMSATQRREKEIGLADGGRVRPRGFVAGKGTTTSDSIPARLSNGEYVLPADTVRAVGVEALDAMREATHKPVKGEQANAARGFFAGGTPGGVGTWFQDQEREQQQRKQEALAAGQAAESAAQAAAAPTQDNTSAAQAAAAPAPGASASQSLAQRVSQIPTGGQTAPAADGSQNSWANTETGRNLSNIASALPGSLGGAIPAVAKTGGAISGGIDAVTRLLNAGVGAAAISAIPGAAPAQGATPSTIASPPTSQTNPTDQRLAAGTQTSPMSGAMNQPKPQPKPQPDAQGDTATTTAREVVPGVYSHGRGQYSDNPKGMGMPEGFTGRPSAQNDAILQRMSDQSQAQSMARVGMSQYDAEVQRAKNINADEAARNNSVGARMQRLADPFTAEGRAMRNLQMNIDSSLDRNGRPTADTAALLAQSKAMSDGYLAEPNQQRTIEAGLEREGMQQAGATTRTGMTEQGANAREAGRNALMRDEFGLKKEAAGFQTRAAAQKEQLRNTLIDPKATPEQRKQAQEYLQALAVSDKEPSPQYKSHVLPNVKNADGSTTEGGVYQENTRTGEGRWVKPQGDGQALPPGMKRQIGTSNGRPVYEDMNGKQVIAKG